MIEPKYDWWGYVLQMVREYPARRKEYTGRELTEAEKRTQEYREYIAVKEAHEITSMYPQGKIRLEVVRLTEWQGHASLKGAASLLYISGRTARRYRWQFLLLVGYRYGYISPDAYYAELKRDNPGRPRKR